MSGVRDEYVDFCDGVRRLTGVDLSAYKRAQMERRIRAFAGAQRIDSLPVYLDVLRGDGEALDRFLDRVTINVSELFRNPDHYTTLRAKVLPELRGLKRVRIWSAGCSYGAEAYTLACIALEDLGSTPVTIVGTDIDRRVIERAKGGHFSRDDARSVPPATLARFFSRTAEGGFVANDRLKRLCTFRTGDLLRDRFDPGWDLILCRNVVIYFTEATRDQVHGALARALRPGAHLMVGATERVADPAAHGLAPAFPFIYRKTS